MHLSYAKTHLILRELRMSCTKAHLIGDGWRRGACKNWNCV